jgi:hypothetical protein
MRACYWPISIFTLLVLCGGLFLSVLSSNKKLQTVSCHGPIYLISIYRPQITSIPARNASLAAMHGSASESNVRYYPTWKHSSLKERRHEHARCLQLGYESLRLLIADQWEAFRPPACSVLPPHYTPQGSTRDLWTVLFYKFLTKRKSGSDKRFSVKDLNFS